jgi:hypothetical protein
MTMSILERLAMIEVTLLAGPQSFETWVALEGLRKIRIQFLAGETAPGKPPITAMMPLER